MKILFICTGNAVRSQMAEGLARAMGPKDWEYKSAGITPAGLQEDTIKSMNEIDIDISHQISKRVEADDIHWADYIITLSEAAQNGLILPPSKSTLHWPIPDPISATGSEKKILKIYAKTRDMIKDKLKDFFESY